FPFYLSFVFVLQAIGRFPSLRFGRLPLLRGSVLIPYTNHLGPVLQEFPGQATDHRSFLRRAGAVDHETVYWRLGGLLSSRWAQFR
ncbi:hypothetical protein LINPERHAP2_LOCUS4639, partial [Linum perenne]